MHSVMTKSSEPPYVRSDAGALAGAVVCAPSAAIDQLPPIKGDEALAKRVWEDVEGLAYLYIWHVLLSF